MLEQLGKCYIYLIGLYMAIGETSLYKIQFPILMREFQGRRECKCLIQGVEFRNYWIFTRLNNRVIMSWHASNKQWDSHLLNKQHDVTVNWWGYDGKSDDLTAEKVLQFLNC